MKVKVDWVTIGVASRAVGLSESALKRLEGRGIISPQRDCTGRRVYTPDEIDAVRKYRGKIAGKLGSEYFLYLFERPLIRNSALTSIFLGGRRVSLFW